MKSSKIALLSGLIAASLHCGINMAEPIHKNIRVLVEQLLSKETGARQDQISIESYSRVEWPSSALGCEQVGKSYLQVITPGFKIDAISQGKHFTIHTSLSNAVVCDQGDQHSILSKTKKMLQIKVKAIQVSRLELLKNREIDKKHVRLISVVEKKSSELSVICDKELKISKQGYLVVLQHKKAQFAYFSDGSHATKCWQKNK